ncbi:hypothetical protein B0H11DRAFT_1352646 [Mycena galericulata]|nr:hypothetical protein B0H11DRAFT_1352646 [Mycena galericulata]
MLQFPAEPRKLSPLPRRSLPSAVATPSNISYPVLTLPFEITTKIFVQCIVETEEPNPGSAPLLLGRICRQWRSIALSTPQLWSSFKKTLNIDKTLNVHASRYSSLLELLQIWFSRSAMHPLKLKIRYGGLRIRPTPEPFHRLLLQQAHRWQEVTLCLPHADLVQLFEEFTGNFPLLQTLDISLPHRTEFIPPLSFAPLSISRFLQTFHVCGDFLRPLTSSVPWTQLTRFDGYRLTRFEGYEIMRLCPLLQECRLYLIQNLTEEPTAAFRPLLLPNLRVLHLRESPSDHSHDLGLLTALTLPALKELDFTPNSDRSNSSHFLDFLSRSSCPLVDLKFNAIMVDKCNFVDLSASLPHLVKLDLCLGIDSPNAIFTVLHGQERYLPLLVSLDISSGPEMDYERLADMLESRSGIDNPEGVVQLQNFQLGHTFPIFLFPNVSSPRPEQIQRLKVLANGGMNIHMDALLLE